MGETAIGELQHHTSGEIANHYACQKIIKSWTQKPDYPSSQIIPTLHMELMNGVHEYQKKGLVPRPPGTYRDTDVETEGRPNNLYVASTDVRPVMIQYTDDLDARLKESPNSPVDKLEQTMTNAAWAYYTFDRIHPFLDGNGRVGRMILKRVMKGKGYKDIIFQHQEIYSNGRNKHMDTMAAVDNSGNLAHLEIYLLEQLQLRYLNEPNAVTLQQINELITKKREDVSSQAERKDLSEIWDGFKGLHLDGVTTPQLAYSE